MAAVVPLIALVVFVQRRRNASRVRRGNAADARRSGGGGEGAAGADAAAPS